MGSFLNGGDSPAEIVGDGVTDDTAAFQAALDTGTSLELSPAQTVLITETVTFPAGCTLNGNGATILCRVPDANGWALDLTGATGATLRDVVLDGDGICYHGWLAMGVDDVLMERVTFQNFLQRGWRTTAVSNRIQCLDCTFKSIRGAADVPNMGISPSHCNDTVISRCTFEDVGEKQGDWAIYDSGTGGALTITENVIYGNLGGIKMALSVPDASLRTVANNQILASDSHGISLNGVLNCHVHHNTVYSQRNPFEMFNSGGIIEDNELISEGTEVGCTIGADTRDAIVRRNAILSITLSEVDCGIYIQGDVANLLVDDNDITGFSFGIYGIFLTSADITISNCTIVQTGVALRFANGDGLEISGNTVEDTGRALYFEDTVNVLITANIFNLPETEPMLMSRVAGVYIWDNTDNAGALEIHPSSTGEWYEEAPPA